uniref:Putative cytochrome n=1 Tax=Corethrella appendiculata TaxID=1370023 RepID=U5EY79_9DIPT
MEINLLTVGIIFAIILIIYYKITKDSYYFCDKPIPSLKPIFPLGSNWKTLVGLETMYDFFINAFNKFPDAKIFGMFEISTPVYVIKDPEVIKKIGVKDFDHFVDHRQFLPKTNYTETDAMFAESLVMMKGQKWRDMRATLSPAFTGSKMRLMFELISECAQNMTNHYVNEAKINSENQINEMKEIFSRYTNDVIASCAFGIKVDSFGEKENVFFMMSQRLSFKKFSMVLKFLLFRIFPGLLEKLKISFMDDELITYFKQIIRDTMNTREKQNIIRPDMINLLMQLKRGKSILHENDSNAKEVEGFATVEESEIGKLGSSKVWKETELIAQCFLFFAAGFDSASTILTFAAYEICVNQDVQQKLYEEIKSVHEALNGKSLTYDDIQKMKYLDMVMTETLRKWPGPITDRTCVKDYHYDDGMGTKFTIEKGKAIFIPIAAFHRDPKYFPNPEKFDPERFNDENKHSINQSAYLPFGVGPRNCIGSRFALMAMKAIIYNLLLKFTFEICEKTQIPIKISKSPFGLFAEKGVWIQFKLRPDAM